MKEEGGERRKQGKKEWRRNKSKQIYIFLYNTVYQLYLNLKIHYFLENNFLTFSYAQ